jgi:hypothetical protein
MPFFIDRPNAKKLEDATNTVLPSFSSILDSLVTQQGSPGEEAPCVDLLMARFDVSKLSTTTRTGDTGVKWEAPHCRPLARKLSVRDKFKYIATKCVEARFRAVKKREKASRRASALRKATKMMVKANNASGAVAVVVAAKIKFPAQSVWVREGLTVSQFQELESAWGSRAASSGSSSSDKSGGGGGGGEGGGGVCGGGGVTSTKNGGEGEGGKGGGETGSNGQGEVGEEGEAGEEGEEDEAGEASEAGEAGEAGEEDEANEAGEANEANEANEADKARKAAEDDEDDEEDETFHVRF